MNVLLTLDRVVCIRSDRLLFEGLSLALNRGEALWLRGPNGAGKSSLIRLAAGLLRPAASSISATRSRRSMPSFPCAARSISGRGSIRSTGTASTARWT